MHLRNDWLDHEVNEIKQEFDIGDRRNDIVFYKLIAVLLLVIFLSANAFAEDPIMGRFFPGVWKCSNKSCGYENYAGINHCALCGTPRK